MCVGERDLLTGDDLERADVQATDDVGTGGAVRRRALLQLGGDLDVSPVPGR
jgi:hypothetical protein